MELMYSMRRKPLRCEPPYFERTSDADVVRPICTISSGNIIAFSSPTELSDTDGDTWGGHVYVCDLDTPWDSYKVVSTTHLVSALEWDEEGKNLLVATTVGEVSVYGQKDFLLNEWICLYSTTFPGEHIKKGVFFHNGQRLVVVDKKHDAPVTEKIQALRSTPTLKGFGGCARGGVALVSSSGLVCALAAGGGRAHDSLRAHRDRVTHASFAHKNGTLLVACVCRGSRGAWCVRVSLCSVVCGPPSPPPAPPAPALLLTPLPTITAPLTHTAPPTAITWCLRPDSDSLLVAGATLTMWRLVERAHNVHKLLVKGPGPGNTTPGGGQKPGTDCYNTLSWQASCPWAVEGARSTALSSAAPGLPARHAVLAGPRALHLLAADTDTHRHICSRAVNTGGLEPATATPPKKAKYGNGTLSGGAVVSCVSLSRLGGVVVAVDSRAQLHVYRLHHDIPPPLYVQHVTTLLEYSLVSGFDCLDILLTLKPNLVEAVYDRITELFQRQPPTFQQFYFHTWLKMRIALLRMVPGAGGSVSWLTSALSLWCVWAAAGAALRPDERQDDKLLAALLDDHHADHDKALLALESKAELPGETAVLCALRRPLQRCVDLALTVLAALPSQHHTHNGYELWTDPVAVSLLRKLVVLARAAGAHGAGAGGGAAGGGGAGAGGGAGGEPALGRLLARLHLPLKPDLLEECSALGATWSARVWEALPRTGVSSPHGKPYPFYLQYGVEPEALRVRPEPPAALADAPAHQMDSIRYMFLGGAGRWRQCGRCGARAVSCAQPARHPVQRAHDNRFLPACRCGGKWALVSNV